MNNRLILAAALASLATGAVAQVPTVADRSTPGGVRAGTYKADPNHTQVAFSLSPMGLSEFSGQFAGGDGSLDLDPAKLSATRLSIFIPIASVHTPVDKLNEELRSDQWLDAAKFPVATFVSTAVRPTGPAAAMVTGNLTLHGVTRPVTLTVRFVGAGTNPLSKAYTVGFHAMGTIKRSDFGVKTYLPLIGDEVHLSLEGAFERQG